MILLSKSEGCKIATKSEVTDRHFLYFQTASSCIREKSI